LFQLNKPAKEC